MTFAFKATFKRPPHSAEEAYARVLWVFALRETGHFVAMHVDKFSGVLVVVAYRDA